MNKNIYLIRHSEQLKIKDTAKCNNCDQIDNEKIILSVNGEKMAKVISDLDELENIQAVWSSNYVRALATAKYIAEKNNLNINVDCRLNERKIGNVEQLKLLGKDKKNTFVNEQLKDIYFKNVDGESCYEVNKRMKNFFENVVFKLDFEKIAIISHGASIKFFLKDYCNLDDEFNLIYKNNKLIVNSPSVFRIKVNKESVLDIKQIY